MLIKHQYSAQNFTSVQDAHDFIDFNKQMRAVKVSTSGILSNNDMDWTVNTTNLGYGAPEMDVNKYKKKFKQKTGPSNQ